MDVEVFTQPAPAPTVRVVRMTLRDALLTGYVVPLDARCGEEALAAQMRLAASEPSWRTRVLLVDEATPIELIARALRVARVRVVLRGEEDLPALWRHLAREREARARDAEAARGLARAFDVAVTGARARAPEGTRREEGP